MSTQPAEGRQLSRENDTAVARKRLPLYGRLIGIFLLLLAMVFVLGASTTSASTLATPTITITGVVSDQNVTFVTQNYPPNQTFVVRMNYMGTLGLGGEVVGTLESGAGGSLTGTYNIPAFLKGQRQIAIRLDSAQAYYSYNWFWNNTNGGSTSGGSGGQPEQLPAAGAGYIGIPTFSIQSVVHDSSVTILTSNFPANQLFDVTMGPMYTQGINGIKVGEINSGTGGAIQATFSIPDQLKGMSRISIRTQTRHTNPYFAYNWFWNSSTDGSSGGSGGDGGTGGVIPPVTGTPAIFICTVNRDQNVTIETQNYPANMLFTVTMGPPGTSGRGGAIAGNFNSGTGGTTRQTLEIPAAVRGYNQISIWAQGSPYYSYNWFWNTTTTADHCSG